MTDRVIAYTVILDKEIREDDAEAIKNALLMVKGVATVTAHVSDLAAQIAKERAKHELAVKLHEVFAV